MSISITIKRLNFEKTSIRKICLQRFVKFMLLNYYNSLTQVKFNVKKI